MSISAQNITIGHQNILNHMVMYPTINEMYLEEIKFELEKTLAKQYNR